MSMVVIITVVVVAGGLVALALRHSSQVASTVPDKTSTRKITVAAKSVSPTSEAARSEPLVFASLAGDPGTSGLHKDLRQYLVKGIDRIFDENASGTDKLSGPLMREQVDPHTLKEALTHLDGMDQFRAQQIRLQKLLNDPAVQMTELSKNITSDPLMTAKVMKMANSSYFGVAQKIDSISHALMILGLQNIKNILYREGLRGMFDTGSAANRHVAATLWRHSNLVCVCAQHFHDLFEGLNRGTLFTLGIVHDIGKLIQLEKFRTLGQAAGLGDEYPMDILIREEDQLFGINHAVIGGCTLEHWNFSELMTQSVLMHHAPSFIEADQVNLSAETLKYTLALFLSDQVARLFTDLHEGSAHIYALQRSYFGLIDKKKLINKITDANFLNQMRAAEMIAVSEHSREKFIDHG
jgi:HD-like signal output (HDOD) protein